jgi:hypothetical protein
VIEVPFGLGGHWVKAQGLVVASREIGSKSLGTWREEWVVEVRPSDAPPFRSNLKWPWSDRGFWPVSEGETISIEYELKSHDLRWDKSDPRTNLLAKTPDGERARQDQAFNDALLGRTPAPTAPGQAGGLDPELQELLDLEAAERAADQARGAAAAAPDAAIAASDGLQGLSFQFDASGQPAAGQVQNVVSAVASGQMRTIRGKSDELLATGLPGTAVVTSASPLGKRVRDINPTADPSRLDDPMWLFTLLVSVANQAPFPAVFGHRVPLAKLAAIGPGMRLVVAVNPADQSNEVAIDWERSPLP